jgi:hypothetical protein
MSLHIIGGLFMSGSVLLNHCGARVVSREDLALVPVPPATKTWFPLGHASVLDTVEKTLGEAGFAIRRSQLSLSRSDCRFFGVLDLESTIATGVSLAVGIRNSVDKSLPIGFCAGTRVFCCDNLAFHSEIVVARKHTRFGSDRYSEALAKAVSGLTQFREAEAARIKRFQYTEIPDTVAESMMLRAYERDIISNRLLPRVIQEWRQPGLEDFQPRNLWSLFNCFTGVLGERQKGDPQKFARLTIALSDLITNFEPAKTLSA